MTDDRPAGPASEGKSASRHDTPAERVYRGSVRALSLVFVALGLAILVTTLASGGGPLSVGVLMGAAFLAVGAGRLWISSRTSG